MKKALENREDIERLVRAFYQKMLADPELGPLFLRVAQISLTEHLPPVYDFWESALFQTGSYRHNLMDIHLAFHQKHRLEKAHFDHWLELFTQTVDELFTGERAQGAKQRARTIATIIQLKIDHLEKQRLEFGN